MPSFIPIEITAIEDDGFHMMLKLHVNGVEARMLIDTGASRSAFDKERINRFFADMPELTLNDQRSTGLGTRDMQSQVLFLDEILIGELSIKKYPAVVLDISHVNLSYEELGLEPIDGVLGSDILMKYGARIDYKEGVMRINKRKVKPKLYPQ